MELLVSIVCNNKIFLTLQYHLVDFLNKDFNIASSTLRNIKIHIVFVQLGDLLLSLYFSLRLEVSNLPCATDKTYFVRGHVPYASKGNCVSVCSV